MYILTERNIMKKGIFQEKKRENRTVKKRVYPTSIKVNFEELLGVWRLGGLASYRRVFPSK